MQTKCNEDIVKDMALRRLSRHDQLALTRHFERLDPDTRRMRFGGGTSREFATRYASRALQIDGVVYGAFPDGKLRGVAELRSLFYICPSTAEAALSVEPEWQNCGIGNALLNRIIASAQRRGINTLYMICLQENKKMQHLTAKHHATMGFCSSQIEATLHPPRPAYHTIPKSVQVFINAMLNVNSFSSSEIQP